MSRLVRVALVLAATLAVDMPAQALEDVRGWRNTTWKMSESEVKRSVRALGLVVTPAPGSPWPSPPADSRSRRRSTSTAASTTSRFTFSMTRASSVECRWAGRMPRARMPLRRHGSLLRMLTDRLGAPSETDSHGPLLSMTRWTFKTTTIALNMYTDTGARERSTQVGVTYSPTAQRVEDREKILGFGLLQLLGGFWKR